MENEKDYFNDLANNVFGIKYLFPYQRLVISNILSSASVDENSDSVSRQIVILPTGYGKSLCYMLPAVILEKPTIVLSPLLSLIKDQSRRLENAGISFSVLAGFLDKEEKQKSIDNIKTGKSKILLTNPESLSLFLDSFKPMENVTANGSSASASYISHLVIDEAHTLPEWGETFRSALLKIKEIIGIIKPDCVTAFTATATPLILKKIQNHIFGDEQINLIVGNPDRPNLFYRVIQTLSIDRETYSIAKKSKKPLLVFCRSRTDTEMTARFLRRALESKDIFFYHAGLEKEEKNNIEKWFFPSKTGILVATCAYGMGIDKPDIRTVIHRNTPQSVEAYLQEAGRGGRDGEISEAILLFDAAEKREKSKFHQEKNDSSRMAQMIDYAENNLTCRRHKLLSYFTDEIPVCSGCDICNKSFIQEPEGVAEIISLIKNNNRKLQKKEIVDILAGAREDHDNSIWYRMSKNYGALSIWQRSFIEEAVDKLVTEGKIKKGKYIWKDVYSVSKY